MKILRRKHIMLAFVLMMAGATMAHADSYDVQAHYLPGSLATTHNLHVDQLIVGAGPGSGLFWHLSIDGNYLEACGSRNSDGSFAGPMGFACDAYVWRFGDLYTLAGYVANASDCGGSGYYCGGAPWPSIRTSPRHVDTRDLPIQRVWYMTASGGKCPNGNQSPCTPHTGHLITQIHDALAEWPGQLVLRMDVYAFTPEGAYQFSEHFWLGSLPPSGAAGLRRFSHIEYGKTAQTCAQIEGAVYDGGPQGACRTVDALLKWAPK